MPVAIIQVSPASDQKHFATSRISRFYSEQRPKALHTLGLASHSERLHGHRMAKLGTSIELSIFSKLSDSSHRSVGALVQKHGEHVVYYQEACRYWVKACLGLPRFKKNGVSTEPPHGRTLGFRSPDDAGLTVCILNSSLFYWFYSVLSDCEHINDDFVRRFPIPSALNSKGWWQKADDLTKAIQSSSKQKAIQTKQGYLIEYDEINAAKERSRIDTIDELLGKAFSLSAEEIDFIRNYDVKYRSSSDGNED